MAQKAKKKSKLRHAEYYDMQKTFDSLYADSKSGEVFGHLMDIISAPSNIKLAFRNIKGNDGSHTAGTDGRTIESLAVMPEDKFVKLIQKQFRRYEPKAVKRVEIPKPNGKMRPLGIPCIIDRIVQQCILQVMEPICEAKFYEHSYGFRPCRSAENAISYAYGLAQRNKLHYVVDVDVKGFFDKERLFQLHAVFHMDEQLPFQFEWDWLAPSGLSTKDFIAPSSFEFRTGKQFRMGKKYGAVSFLQILAPELNDRLLADFLDMESSLIVSMHIQSVDQVKAIKTV